MGKDKNKDKEHQDEETAATSSETITSPGTPASPTEPPARIGKQGMLP